MIRTLIHWKKYAGGLFLLLLLQSGCRDQNSVAQAEAPKEEKKEAAGKLHLDHAQPRLPTIKLWLGAEELVTEIARTRQQQATGMMFRKEMAENEAMIFVFDFPHRTAFYMKNTELPLSAAYIDHDGKILEIHPLKPFELESVEAESDQIQYVLETREGWFERHKVAVGTVIRTEKGTLQETFFGRKAK